MNKYKFDLVDGFVNNLTLTILTALAFLFSTAVFSQYNNNDGKEALWNAEDGKYFVDYGDFNETYEHIITEFVADTKKHLNIDLNADDLFVMDFDYTILDMAWEGEYSNGVLGMAIGMYNDDMTIVILNKDKMATKSYTEIKATIYHELMHDVFNYEHEYEADMLMSPVASKYDADHNFVASVIEQAFDIVKHGDHQDHEEFKPISIEPVDWNDTWDDEQWPTTDWSNDWNNKK